MAYTNSSLVTYTNITKNKTSPRNHEIDTITIHCYVGQVTAKQGCDYFATTDRQASSNYIIGYDGSIGLSVDEKDRSWCTDSPSNDNRAITIEVACEPTHPYTITDKALESLIKLIADICERNNIKELKWKGDKSLIGQVDKQNMTVHRWFAAKACPGDYLYGLHGTIADRVNALLNESKAGWTQDDTGWKYKNSDGSFTKDKWQQIDGKWYCFNASGYMKTGWVFYKNVWYYLQKNGSMLTNGWAKDSKGWYYMGSDGKPKTGWLQLGEKWYYLNSDGLMQTGIQKINGKLYYFSEDDDGHMCRTDENGALV